LITIKNIFLSPSLSLWLTTLEHRNNDDERNEMERQFGAVENGITVTKLMQIFSRQAAMMDALISHFAEQMRRRKDGTDAIENNVADDGKIFWG
jgi:hypothetical protein